MTYNSYNTIHRTSGTTLIDKSCISSTRNLNLLYLSPLKIYKRINLDYIAEKIDIKRSHCEEIDVRIMIYKILKDFLA